MAAIFYSLRFYIFWAFGMILPEGVSPHGRLIDPPQRSSMWRFGFNTPPNYNDNELNCGGFENQYSSQGGRCGVCGDPYQGPRANEAGGRYATGLISRKYVTGQIIDVVAEITANHQGWFEIRLCPNNDNNRRMAQSCFDRFLLEIIGHGTRYMVKNERKSLFRLHVKLPGDLSCSQCVLQWKYFAGNSEGFTDGTGNCMGCGPQETFINCADVSIGVNIAIKPREIATSQAPLLTTHLPNPVLLPIVPAWADVDSQESLYLDKPILQFLQQSEFDDIDYGLLDVTPPPVESQREVEEEFGALKLPASDVSGNDFISDLPDGMLEGFMEADMIDAFWDDVTLFLEQSATVLKDAVINIAVDFFPASSVGVRRFHDLVKLALLLQDIPHTSHANPTDIDTDRELLEILNDAQIVDNFESITSENPEAKIDGFGTSHGPSPRLGTVETNVKHEKSDNDNNETHSSESRFNELMASRSAPNTTSTELLRKPNSNDNSARDSESYGEYTYESDNTFSPHNDSKKKVVLETVGKAPKKTIRGTDTAEQYMSRQTVAVSMEDVNESDTLRPAKSEELNTESFADSNALDNFSDGSSNETRSLSRFSFYVRDTSSQNESTAKDTTSIEPSNRDSVTHANSSNIYLSREERGQTTEADDTSDAIDMLNNLSIMNESSESDDSERNSDTADHRTEEDGNQPASPHSNDSLGMHTVDNTSSIPESNRRPSSKEETNGVDFEFVDIDYIPTL